MALRCPKCRMPSYVPASEVGETGRLVRCSYCDTTWLARHFQNDPYAGDRSGEGRPVRRRPPLIIDGEIGRPRRFAGAAAAAAPGANAGFASRPSAAARYGFTAGATALVLALIAAVLLTPTVAALPNLGGFGPGSDELSLEGVTSKEVTLRGSSAILVEGEIVNRSGREIEVPAVRLALKEKGSEVYAWLMEPTVQRVAAGGSIGFRSAMASPRPGASHVAASLAGRPASDGMNR